VRAERKYKRSNESVLYGKIGGGEEAPSHEWGSCYNTGAAGTCYAGSHDINEANDGLST